jgi:hypothetical protein
MTAQSRRASLIEVISSVAIGYAIACLTQAIVFPWFGLHVSIGTNMTIGAIFTVISIIRSYIVRRLFEALRVKGALA